MRVPVEVIRGIRKRLGPDFPLFFRCSVEEYLPGGITLELARDIARTVADNGIDLFNVSVGLGETNRLDVYKRQVQPFRDVIRIAAEQVIRNVGVRRLEPVRRAGNQPHGVGLAASDMDITADGFFRRAELGLDVYKRQVVSFEV